MEERAGSLDVDGVRSFLLGALCFFMERTGPLMLCGIKVIIYKPHCGVQQRQQWLAPFFQLFVASPLPDSRSSSTDPGHTQF